MSKQQGQMYLSKEGYQQYPLRIASPHPHFFFSALRPSPLENGFLSQFTSFSSHSTSWSLEQYTLSSSDSLLDSRLRMVLQQFTRVNAWVVKCCSNAKPEWWARLTYKPFTLWENLHYSDMMWPFHIFFSGWKTSFFDQHPYFWDGFLKSFFVPRLKSSTWKKNVSQCWKTYLQKVSFWAKRAKRGL